MMESSTYRATIAEGMKKALLALGRKRFGPPDERTSNTLERIRNLNRLERMSERLLDVANWAGLLAEPQRRRRNGRRQKRS